MHQCPINRNISPQDSHSDAKTAIMASSSSDTPACQAVLETYELLEMILSQLPVETIQNMKRVSKTWCKMVENSKAVIRSAVLVLIKALDGTCITPRYSDVKTLFTHAFFEGETFPVGFGLQAHFCDRCYVLPVDEGDGTGDYFATNPPSQATLIRLRWRVEVNGSMFGREGNCTIYVRTGIRIHDLLSIQKMLAAQAVTSNMNQIYNLTCVADLMRNQ
jgi:hypothetical protein